MFDLFNNIKHTYCYLIVLFQYCDIKLYFMDVFFPLLTAYLILFQFCSKFDLDRGKDTMLHTDATMTNFILYITTPCVYFSASV